MGAGDQRDSAAVTIGAWTTALWACLAAQPAFAVEISGLLDLRLGASDSAQSWPNGGLGKTRFDRSSTGLRVGQGFLKLQGDVLDAVTGSVVFSAADDRKGVLDVNEAWLAWNPVPTSAWKSQLRVGAFFPVTSLEIDYDSIGWTPRDTISSSAINSWIGEELRTVGLEYKLLRNGRQAGSAHDFGFTAGVFAANDPAGALLAWRGWSISDRITGLTETISLADLPAFKATGALPSQTRSMNVFRELDQRLGFYASAQYAYAGKFELAAMRYDNRGDPMVLQDGQYAWLTRFNHVGARLKNVETFVGKWEFSAQWLAGDTLMGPGAVYVDFASWFLLASRPLGPGSLAIRYDQFSTSERAADLLPNDPNSETGRALALAYRWTLSPQLSLVSEFLVVQSERAARLLLGQPAQQVERSFSTSLRWSF